MTSPIVTYALPRKALRTICSAVRISRIHDDRVSCHVSWTPSTGRQFHPSCGCRVAAGRGTSCRRATLPRGVLLSATWNRVVAEMSDRARLRTPILRVVTPVGRPRRVTPRRTSTGGCARSISHLRRSHGSFTRGYRWPAPRWCCTSCTSVISGRGRCTRSRVQARRICPCSCRKARGGSCARTHAVPDSSRAGARRRRRLEWPRPVAPISACGVPSTAACRSMPGARGHPRRASSRGRSRVRGRVE